MLLLMLACRTGSVVLDETLFEPDSGAAPVVEEPPTWHQDVAPILAASCNGCHTEGALASYMPFDDYSIAAPLADNIADQVATEAMPPFMARETEECENPWGFLHDPRLTDDEKDTITAWAAANAPEGDPDSAAPLPEPLGYTLEGANAEVVPPQGHTTSLANARDEFICYSVPLGNEVDDWLTGIEVVPDQREVVHHVTLFLDASGSSAELAGEDGMYSCFGGTMLAETTFLGAWVPGASPMQTPENTGWLVPAGARLVAQVHYHPTPEETTDQTRYRLRWAETPPERLAFVALIGNDQEQASDGSGLQPGPDDRTDTPEFRIPAGSAGHQELMRWDVPETLPEMSVWFVLNHMHYIGTGMKVWIEHADEREDSCLLQTPEWDFNWQQSFDYDATNDRAPVLRGGDTIWIRCTYDNSLENESVVDALAENGLTEPQDVTIGEGSLDEMCLVGIGVIAR